MKHPRAFRFLLWAIAVCALLGVAAIAVLHFTVQQLREHVIAALGSESEVGEIKLGLSTLEISNLRIKAPDGWPTRDSLRASRVIIVPDWRALLSSRVHIHSITLEGGYLSIWRHSNGKTRLLPSLLEHAKAAASAESGKREVIIDRIAMQQGDVDFYDSTVSKTPYKIPLSHADITLEALNLPAVANRSPLTATATLAGSRRRGSVDIRGWMIFADKSSVLSTRLRGIDLITLQPYLLKATETRVKRGTLDLDLNSTIENRQLKAPGVLTLSDLELKTPDGFWNTLSNAPRQAALSSLKDERGKIVLRFTLTGNLHNPRFVLNEDLNKRMGLGVAEGIGLTIKGLAGGVGKTISKIFGQ
ncbi:hypothetical protein IGB42_00941 [Andreprevotia sp. IGB-42]|uniref:DUF748 domain-containing protein n=1 Tax=Andreprevotia sp. IGB-42 TaxID=2497473 RepID=UPI001359D20E|nr:DUF748 domain-containing protein [Andreprevotia sp. IGB-42]KAF0814885.1 hypothetical protein IGB42_00941 [Andreprevotia sp. IGB-42]